MPDEIIFNQKGHRYFVNGEEVPSVSEIIRFVAREVYDDIGQATLNLAADRGTRVHKFTEELDTDGCTIADDECLPYVKAYRDFLLECSPTWMLTEHPINNNQQYAGTIDRYGEINGKYVLLDIKTSSMSKKKQVLYTAQLNLYRLALEAHGYQVDELYILNLKKDGTYKLIPIEQDSSVAVACLLLHRELTKKKTKKKKG